MGLPPCIGVSHVALLYSEIFYTRVLRYSCYPRCTHDRNHRRPQTRLQSPESRIRSRFILAGWLSCRRPMNQRHHRRWSLGGAITIWRRRPPMYQLTAPHALALCEWAEFQGPKRVGWRLKMGRIACSSLLQNTRCPQLIRFAAFIGTMTKWSAPTLEKGQSESWVLDRHGPIPMCSRQTPHPAVAVSHGRFHSAG